MARGDGPRGKGGGGTRLCPLCAETIRAEAKKCKFCGSTLVGLEDLPAPAARPDLEPASSWPAPGPDDVGLAGPLAVAGALLGFGVGAWAGTGVGVVLALCGSGAGFALGWARDPREPDRLLPSLGATDEP